jgi:hypothetical protein
MPSLKENSLDPTRSGYDERVSGLIVRPDEHMPIEVTPDSMRARLMELIGGKTTRANLANTISLLGLDLRIGDADYGKAIQPAIDQAKLNINPPNENPSVFFGGINFTARGIAEEIGSQDIELTARLYDALVLEIQQEKQRYEREVRCVIGYFRGIFEMRCRGYSVRDILKAPDLKREVLATHILTAEAQRILGNMRRAINGLLKYESKTGSAEFLSENVLKFREACLSLHEQLSNLLEILPPKPEKAEIDDGISPLMANAGEDDFASERMLRTLALDVSESLKKWAAHLHIISREEIDQLMRKLILLSGHLEKEGSALDVYERHAETGKPPGNEFGFKARRTAFQETENRVDIALSVMGQFMGYVKNDIRIISDHITPDMLIEARCQGINQVNNGKYLGLLADEFSTLQNLPGKTTR